MTVGELISQLNSCIEAGVLNRSAKIILSSDAEGNRYHGLFQISLYQGEPHRVCFYADDVEEDWIEQDWEN